MHWAQTSPTASTSSNWRQTWSPSASPRRTELTVDLDWTSATTEAVKDWQESRGLARTGVVAQGDVVFLPGPVRVAEHPAPVGSAASGTVLGVTSTTQVVTVELAANRRSLVEPGKPVVVVLPGDIEVAGTVYTVGDVATTDSSDGDDGSDDGGGPRGDGRRDHRHRRSRRPDRRRVRPGAGHRTSRHPRRPEGVLAVPVEALLALAEGGYAVELAHDDGTTSLVAVELGAFAGGWVEVTGDVAEGDQVEVPE